MDTYYSFNRGLWKVVNNFIMTELSEDAVSTGFVRDPTNSQIFNFLVRPTEIHWVERGVSCATIYFKATANHLPENFDSQGRKTYSHTFLRASVIDPTMWYLPVEDGRGFAIELLEDVRQRWNLQMASGKRMFKNEDPLNGSPHLDMSDAEKEMPWLK
ncbi:MAG TPA: hypothetical protein ENI05_04445 [Porticoccus sp.]|nr:hypothetical protein [Porticoccus sp.]